MDSSPGRVLVVDDNEDNRDMLSRRLERSGHAVITAVDGQDALRRVEEHSFDVILLDVMMPGIDGFEVLRRLRERFDATRLPVIMATAKDQREDIVQALKLGANDYVTKPLDYPVVLARVNTQLSLKRAVDRVILLEADLRQRNQALAEVNERMRRDLQAAAAVQRALLPSAMPQTPAAEFAWAFVPCDELAGDIFNVFMLDDHHVGMYLLDVSGHGVRSSLLSVTLSRVLTPLPGQASLVQRSAGDRLEPTPPGLVASELNRRFQMDFETEQYFTLAYVVVNLQSRELRYVSAGHPGPVFCPTRGDATDLTHGAMPIGWMPELAYEEKVLRFEPGDRLYLYSDGIKEALRSDRSQFGVERIVQSVSATRRASLQESIDGLVVAAREFADGAFDDDVSAVAVELR